MDVLDIVVQAVRERKSENVCVYDVRRLTPYVDDLVVATSHNLRQNNAIANHIREKLKEAGYQGKYRVEGDQNSRWLLIDLGEIVVHLFVNEERAGYGLDKLYGDVPMKRYDV